MIFFGKKSCFKNVEKDDSPVGLSALRLKTGGPEAAHSKERWKKIIRT